MIYRNTLFLIFILIFNYCLVWSQSNAGLDKFICRGSTITIGALPEDPKFCYSWVASPADPTMTSVNTAKIKVSPSQTTTYTFTVTGQDFSSRSVSSIIVTVVENNTFPQSNAILTKINPSINIITKPTYWGLTLAENINVDITACSDGTNWHAIVLSITGNYSSQVRLLPNVKEVLGPGGNTLQSNFCDQVSDLIKLSQSATNWYMISAIQAHEDVHVKMLQPALESAVVGIEPLFETLTIIDNGQTLQQAVSQIKSSPEFQIDISKAQDYWRISIDILDPMIEVLSAPQYTAERNIAYPMVLNICNFAKAQMWGLCAACPP